MASGKKIDVGAYGHITEELKKRRINLGISQIDLSKHFGYARGNFICTLENNQTAIPIGKIANAGVAYQLDPGMLAMALIKARNPDIWSAVKLIIDSAPVREGMTIDQIEKEVDTFVDNIGNLSIAATK